MDATTAPDAPPAAAAEPAPASAAHVHRETWLRALASAMEPRFRELGHPLPTYRVSCGWPVSGALAKKGGARTIGQCFAPECSADGVSEVFVSPVLDEAMRVADVLAHELAHAAVGCAAGHGPRFAKVAYKLGLEGPATATTAGDDFKAWVAPLLEQLGAYPHASLDLTKTPSVKKQGTRMAKCTCGECGYTARTTRKWLDSIGAPLCPCNSEPMDVDGAGDGEEG